MLCLCCILSEPYKITNYPYLDTIEYSRKTSIYKCDKCEMVSQGGVLLVLHYVVGYWHFISADEVDINQVGICYRFVRCHWLLFQKCCSHVDYRRQPTYLQADEINGPRSVHDCQVLQRNVQELLIPMSSSWTFLGPIHQNIFQLFCFCFYLRTYYFIVIYSLLPKV